MDGYIKLYRSLLNWEWWDDQNTTRLWTYILINANFRESQWHGRTVFPGQLIASRATLSEKTSLSEQSIRTSLNKLKSTGELTIETTSNYSVITIANWTKFQSDDEQSTSKTTINASLDQPTTNQPATSDQPQRKKDKKEKKEKNINPISLFEQSILNFIEFRKRIDKPMTEHAIDLLKEKLQKLAGDDEQKKIAIIDQSIFYSWQGVFELKTEKPETPKTALPRKSHIETINGEEVTIFE